MIGANTFKLRTMKIELTDCCRLNCCHCSSNATAAGVTTIGIESCLQILADASALGLEKVAFSGGEPLLYPNLMTVIRHAADYKMYVSIYTTGNVNNFNEMAQDLKSCGAHRMIFSIFSNTEHKHEAVTRTPGSFHATCAAISVAKKLGFKVELHFVPLSSNHRELQDVIKMGLRLGASKVSILRFVPQGRGEKIRDQVLLPKQNIELRESILNLRNCKENVIRTGSPYNFLMLDEQPQCMAAKDRLTVLPDLKIVPCDAFKRIRAETFAGDSNFSSLSSASLAECWVKSSYLNAVRQYLTTDFAEECRSCESLSMCHSGCLAQKFLSIGDRRKSKDPDCLRGRISAIY